MVSEHIAIDEVASDFPARDYYQEENGEVFDNTQDPGVLSEIVLIALLAFLRELLVGLGFLGCFGEGADLKCDDLGPSQLLMPLKYKVF